MRILLALILMVAFVGCDNSESAPDVDEKWENLGTVGNFGRGWSTAYRKVDEGTGDTIYLVNGSNGCGIFVIPAKDAE